MGGDARPDDQEDRALAGSGGDDISAGTSVSGVGGQALRTADEEAGLPPAHKAPESEQLVAGNEGTGQSEKPDRSER